MINTAINKFELQKFIPIQKVNSPYDYLNFDIQIYQAFIKNSLKLDLSEIFCIESIRKLIPGRSIKFVTLLEDYIIDGYTKKAGELLYINYNLFKTKSVIRNIIFYDGSKYIFELRNLKIKFLKRDNNSGLKLTIFDAGGVDDFQIIYKNHAINSFREINSLENRRIYNPKEFSYYNLI